MKSKEERFIELIGDYYIEVFSNDFPNKILYKNTNNELLIYYNKKNGWLNVSFEKIWLFFEKEYDMTYDDIGIFMKKMLDKHFKIKGYPRPLRFSFYII